MSATIATNDSKFVIFGSGHDYTRLDSGSGDIVFFSHPFVPLNSVNYAGQYLFYVPDEDGNSIDAVKDDIAHCTFDPAIGTTFDTEGEVEVKVHYRREYIHDEETILVEKELSQTITVVDHGTISQSGYYADVYSDGYHFWRPNYASQITDFELTGVGSPTKSSCIMWRVTKLGVGIYNFMGGNNLTDISELAYADTSNVTIMSRLFDGARNLSDISALASWDVSKVTTMTALMSYLPITDLSSLASWNTESLTSLKNAFCNEYLTSLHGLENWNVSNVTDLESTFNGCRRLIDLSALANWDVSKVTSMVRTFMYCMSLSTLHGLENWNLESLTNMEYCFGYDEGLTTLIALSNWSPAPTNMRWAFQHCISLKNLEGVGNFDVSNVTNMQEVFNFMPKLLSLSGVETWDVSNVTSFYRMFAGCVWLQDITAINDWDFSSATNTAEMFSGLGAIVSVDDINLDLSTVTSMGSMFGGFDIYFADEISDYVWESAYYYFDYEGHQYSKLGLTTTLIRKNATNAQNWAVGISNANAFSSGTWDNKPSWN